MKFNTTSMAIAAALATQMLLGAAAQASVLTFDDLSGTSAFTSTYKGFSFGNLSLSTNPWFWSDEPSTVYTAHSGTTSVSTDYTLYHGLDSEATLPISNSTPFVFSGAYFSGESTNADGTKAAISYELYNGGTLVYTSGLSSQLSSTSTFFSSGYTNAITSVVISGPQGYYAMDDFTYTLAPVPEPASWALFGLGLVALALVRGRKAESLKP